MDVKQRMAADLPDAVESLEKHGPIEIAELWLMARAYSRLRHRHLASPPSRRGGSNTKRSRRICINLAVTRAPASFLVFVDPGYRHLMVIYHRDRSNAAAPSSRRLARVRRRSQRGQQFARHNRRRVEQPSGSGLIVTGQPLNFELDRDCFILHFPRRERRLTRSSRRAASSQPGLQHDMAMNLPAPR